MVLLFKTQESYLNMGFTTRVVDQRLFGLFHNFWFLVSTYILPLFGVMTAYFFRLDMKNDFVKHSSSNLCEMNEKIVNSYVNEKQEKGCKEDVFCGGFYEEEPKEFSFRFKFPTYEEFSKTKRESGGFVSLEAIPSTSIDKCDLPKKNLCLFSVQEPKTVTLGMEKVNAEHDVSLESEYVRVEEEYLSDVHVNVAPLEELEEMKGRMISEKNERVIFRRDGGDDFDEENSLQVSDEVESFSMDSELKWICTDGFLSEKDFGETSDLDYLMDIDDEKAKLSDEMSDYSGSQSSNGFKEEDRDIMKELGKLEQDQMDSTKSDTDVSQESSDFEEDSDIMEELRKLEDHMDIRDKITSNFLTRKDSDSTKSDTDVSQESYDFEEDSDVMEELRKLEDHMDIRDKITSNFLTRKDSDERLNDSNQGEICKSINTATNSELSESKNISNVEIEDTNKLETLWEHQDLVEQLKMELKKVRASGLPTILEDSESPKIMEDLKPWKIDEKFQHQNPMGELHKFYKSYREKMRKLDVLTYQKMYAIGFLQLKEPGNSSSTKKTSIPDIASIISENSYQYKAKKHETDPMKKLINELQTELELVYVGQMCLSWDFLHWQYGMALDLWDSDPRGISRYNEVAGEFQQFQVLVQRFLEDEPFQGPRVQYYIKRRCVYRDFLQIPVIREDILNDGKKRKGIQRGDIVITSDMLVEILEESIRLFWRFISADKRSTHAKARRQKAVLAEPEASEILLELQKDLQKKVKNLKHQMRSSHCILKKFSKCQEDDSSSANQVLFFFSQVDLKLVSRVLSMSKLTTEQLAWCRSKLNSISFLNKKVHIEPSFCLFPC